MSNSVLTIKLSLPHILTFVATSVCKVQIRVFFCLNYGPFFSWKCTYCMQTTLIHTTSITIVISYFFPSVVGLIGIWYPHPQPPPAPHTHTHPLLLTKIIFYLVDSGKTLWMDPEAARKWFEANSCWCSFPYPGKFAIVPLYVSIQI